jgi:hypothetical protein
MHYWLKNTIFLVDVTICQDKSSKLTMTKAVYFSKHEIHNKFHPKLWNSDRVDATIKFHMSTILVLSIARHKTA